MPTTSPDCPEPVQVGPPLWTAIGCAGVDAAAPADPARIIAQTRAATPRANPILLASPLLSLGKPRPTILGLLQCPYIAIKVPAWSTARTPCRGGRDGGYHVGIFRGTQLPRVSQFHPWEEQATWPGQRRGPLLRGCPWRLRRARSELMPSGAPVSWDSEMGSKDGPISSTWRSAQGDLTPWLLALPTAAGPASTARASQVGPSGAGPRAAPGGAPLTLYDQARPPA